MKIITKIPLPIKQTSTTQEVHVRSCRQPVEAGSKFYRTAKSLKEVVGSDIALCITLDLIAGGEERE